MDNALNEKTPAAGEAPQTDVPFCPFMSFQMLAPTPMTKNLAVNSQGQLDLRPVAQPCLRDQCALADVSPAGSFVKCGMSGAMQPAPYSALMFIGQQANETKSLIRQVADALDRANRTSVLSNEAIRVVREAVTTFTRLVMALLEKYTGDKQKAKSSKGQSAG